MHDRRAGLVVLGLGNPHLLERGQRGKDGPTDPDRVLPLGRRNHLDLHGGGREGGELLGHPLADAGEHGGSARQHDVAVEVLTDVDVALHDRLERAVVDARGLHSDERGLEQHLRIIEPRGSEDRGGRRETTSDAKDTKMNSYAYPCMRYAVMAPAS